MTGHEGGLARAGFSLVELLVVMVASLALVAGAVPLLRSGNQALEHQASVRQVQAGVHVAAEVLMMGLRSAEGVLDTSHAARVVLEGGDLETMCGGSEFWIEADSTGLQCGPVGGARVRTIAATVSGFLAEFGVDQDGNGSVDLFTSTPTSAQLEDTVAVRFRLESQHAFGRGAFSSATEFVAVLRNAVLERVELQ